MPTKGSSSFIVRLYFAVVAAVTLFTLMYGVIDFLALGLKTFVFTNADVPTYLENCDSPNGGYAGDTKPVPAPGQTAYTDEELKTMCESRNATQVENYEREKANSAVRNLALVIVSLPLFLIHFRFVYRDWKEDRG
jgi:hypothetical protein